MLSKTTHDIPEFLDSFLDRAGTTIALEFPSTMDVLLDYLRVYSSTLEEYLETERVAVHEKLRAYPEASDYLEEHLFVIEKIYRNLLRKSILTAVYTVLEDGLRRRCLSLQRLKELPFSADEIKGRSNLDKYQTYIERLTSIEFEKLDEWKPFHRWGEIRNQIVHQQGMLKPGNKELAKFIRGNANIREEDGEIILERGACPAFIDIVQRFFEFLDRQLPEECRDVEPHFGFRP
jgi:hypothetical protein